MVAKANPQIQKNMNENEINNQQLPLEVDKSSYRSLKEECESAGTYDCEIYNTDKKHAFFLAGQSYYLGSSLHGFTEDEIFELGCKGKVGIVNLRKPGEKKWVPCLFLRKAGKSYTLRFE